MRLCIAALFALVATFLLVPVSSRAYTSICGNNPIYCTATQCNQTTNTCGCDATVCTGPLQTFYGTPQNINNTCVAGCKGQQFTVGCAPGGSATVCSCSCASCFTQTQTFTCSGATGGWCFTPCASPTPPPGATPTTPPVVCIPGSCWCAGSLAGGPGLSCVPNAGCPNNAACCTADNPPGCAVVESNLL